MSTTIKKALGGKQDLRFYTAASPTFSRTTSTGGSTTLNAIAATHLPVVQSAASLYWSQNTVQRALNEGISRYFGIDHSTATYSAGAVVGEHLKVFGFRSSNAATSIQAAASNSYLRDGVARIILKNGTTTAATPIALPRKAMLIGNNRATIVRASSTIQTSRVFSIAGSTGATNTTLNAAATVNTTLAPFSSSAGFAIADWFYVQGGTNMEQHQIRSIAGNAVTTQEPFLNRFASGGTVRLIYPAELYLDNMEIQLSSATQGIGVAATYLVHSYFGPNLRITGAARAGMLLQRSSYNRSEAAILNPKTITAGFGYGVRMTDGSNKNEIDGFRSGVLREVADGGSCGNQLVGRLFYTNAAASFNASATRQYSVDPMAYIMRMRKPELSYTTYAATTVVTCPANNQTPAEVYINGNIYRNLGTTLCDLSRTITPANATIGGLDRGPATATRAYYIYAYPTVSPSATRQFNLVASAQSPATGPTASATFPSWSYLGPVATSGSTVRLLPFVQCGDRFSFQQVTTFSDPSTSAYQATYRFLTHSMIPVGAKYIALNSFVAQPAAAQLNPSYYTQFAAIGESGVGKYHTYHQIGGQTSTTSLQSSSIQFDVPVNSVRRYGYLNNFNGGGSGAATVTTSHSFSGYLVNRGEYK